MESQTTKDRLAFEASVRANAIRYAVHLFIGRGVWERHETATLGEAISTGDAMKIAYPDCQAEPIYYAIEASGHSTTITPAQFNEEKPAMIRAESEIKVTRPPAMSPEEKRKANTEAKRRARAAAKQAKAAPAPSAKTEAPKVAKLSRTDKRIAKIKADLAAPKAEKAVRKQRATTGIATPKTPTGKRAAIEEAARAGKLPTAPDFRADTHKPYRLKLEALVLHAKEGNIAALKAFPINPTSSSPKALDRYRNLCVIALEAKAALAKAA
jgi:hypothetical protein